MAPRFICAKCQAANTSTECNHCTCASCKYGCAHSAGSCGGQRIYYERFKRWDTLCQACTHTKSLHRRLQRKAAKEKSVADLTLSATTPPSSLLTGYVGVDSDEVAFVTRLLVAVRADPVLMAAWQSEKDDLFSEFVLLECRRKTKSSSIEENLESLRGHLAVRIEHNAPAVRDDILKHDKSLNELPMYKEWHGSGILSPVAVSHSNRSIVYLYRDCDAASVFQSDQNTMIKGRIAFLVHGRIVSRALMRATRAIYRGK